MDLPAHSSRARNHDSRPSLRSLSLPLPSCSDSLPPCEGGSRWGVRPFATLLLLIAAALNIPSPAQAEEPLDFDRDIRPILSKNCFACHGPDE
ncbi:MAG TPA: hypothetical protein VFT74_06015, partial [Isosphaeraceae bacterium]|nr:hypothetical protein [Isosphaeraceae bacterium]